MYQNLYVVLLYLVLKLGTAIAYTISPEPYVVFNTPNSIMHRISPAYAQFVGSRPRFSTCTGVAWFADSRHLISANLLESSLQSYEFIPSIKKILQKKKYDKSITQLGWPENIAVSKDGRYLAVSNSYRGGVNVFRLYPETSSINASPISQIIVGDHGLHGVRFSSDGKYIGYVTYDGLGKIRIFQMREEAGKNLNFVLTHTLDSTFEGMSFKGLDFSSDMKFIAICCARKICSQVSDVSGKLAIFRFDAEHGVINPTPICEIGTEACLNGPEDVIFCLNDFRLLVSNQGNDTISIHTFDPVAGSIYDSNIALQSPRSQLNFPHGISISPDGNYLAVSNYGDDKICVYTLTQN